MPDAGLSAGIETHERKQTRFSHSRGLLSGGGKARPGHRAFAQTSIWEPVMKGGGGATAPGGFLKETTLTLRSGRQIREECSFQTEADRMRGELCGVNSRDRVEASEGVQRAGMRADGLEGRSGAGPSGPGSLSRGGMALRIGRR